MTYKSHNTHKTYPHIHREGIRFVCGCGKGKFHPIEGSRFKRREKRTERVCDKCGNVVIDKSSYGR